jgi:hypothetical protein
MQAIRTNYIPPTNKRGSRIKASCERGSITVPFEHGAHDAHEVAAVALIARFLEEDFKERGEPKEKNPWSRPFVSGGLPDGSNAFVFLP